MSKKSVKPQKSQAPFLGLIAVVALVGGVVLYMVTRPSVPEAIAVDPSAPSVEAQGYIFGSPDAPITITEFADFECGGCAQFALLHTPDIKKRIVETGVAKFEFLDHPLSIHPNAMAAHLAAACADDQGKFWEMHDRIFNTQFDWNSQATANPKKVLATSAEALALDMNAWNECFDSRKHLARIEANRNAGIKLGVRSTPSIQVGGRIYAGGLTADQVKQIVDSMAADGATPTAIPSASPTPAP